MNYKQEYKKFQKKINAYSYALWLLRWDAQTQAPKKSREYRNKQLQLLQEKAYSLLTDKTRIKAIKALYQSKITGNFKREIQLEKKRLDNILKVPKKEYLAYQKLLNESHQVWALAKEKNDFSLFAPVLDQIIAYNKKLIEYLKTDKLSGYDVLLDKYEEDMGIKEYDEFFGLLRERLVPFVNKITNIKLPFPESLANNTYKSDKQKQFSQYLLDVLYFDLNKGVLSESIHPFTSGVVSCDVRITTAYKEKAFDSAIFSTIHEVGHGLYEQQINSRFNGTILSSVKSLGMHESQSRLYENIIGRSYAFWEKHYDKLKEIFAPKFDDISLDDFYLFINQARKSFIRVDADELTYSLHIMIRYEIEKQIFNGNIKTSELPNLWNQLTKKYLGLEVKNDQEGILQDIHWSGGSFGYFPTYALGSAYAVQIYNSMALDIDIKKAIKNNEISKINLWLKNNIHQYGSLKTPKELMKKATKKDFNPVLYVDYLINKYKNIYKNFL